MRQACILVGGRGTRLGSLTDSVPKPLLDVSGRPFLDYLLENIARHGVKDIVLLSGYRADNVADRYNGRTYGASRIRCIAEPEPRGTFGALQHAKDALADAFYVLNGDTFFDINLLDLGLAPDGALAHIALRQVPQIERHGGVVLAGNRIIKFAEKSGSGPGVINGGVYWMTRKLVEDCQGRSLEEDVFLRLADSAGLFGRIYERPFIDIGIPADLSRAQTAVPEWFRRPAVFFDRDGVLNRDHGYVHKPEDFDWLPGAKQAIKLANDQGAFVFVVTNQAGIARGFYAEDNVLALHDWMNEQLGAVGAHVDAFYYCPHHPHGVRPGYQMVCDCRKPAPGLINKACNDWPVLRQKSFLLGDKTSDLAAAESAGIAGHLVHEGDHLAAIVAKLL
jgi:D-glycero-D-manno-heptose 1,7-bisphosphate phosphatase